MTQNKNPHSKPRGMQVKRKLNFLTRHISQIVLTAIHHTWQLRLLMLTSVLWLSPLSYSYSNYVCATAVIQGFDTWGQLIQQKQTIDADYLCEASSPNASGAPAQCTCVINLTQHGEAGPTTKLCCSWSGAFTFPIALRYCSKNHTLCHRRGVTDKSAGVP